MCTFKVYTLFALSFVGRGVGITAAFRRSPFLLFSLSLSLSRHQEQNARRLTNDIFLAREAKHSRFASGAISAAARRGDNR